MLDKLPAGLLHNLATSRWHPIIFRYNPPPSGDLEYARRYKSIGHHTKGFDMLAEAQAHIAEHADWVDTHIVWDWTGEDTPAMVEWFPKNLGQQKTEQGMP